MGQSSRVAITDMLTRHRLQRIEEAKKNAHYGNMQLWHKIALLHYGDLLEIGINLRSIKEMLPAVNARNRHRITAEDYMTRIKPQPDHVIYDDLGMEVSFFQDLMDPTSRRIRRSIY